MPRAGPGDGASGQGASPESGGCHGPRSSSLRRCETLRVGKPQVLEIVDRLETSTCTVRTPGAPAPLLRGHSQHPRARGPEPRRPLLAPTWKPQLWACPSEPPLHTPGLREPLFPLPPPRALKAVAVSSAVFWFLQCCLLAFHFSATNASHEMPCLS